MLRPWLLLLASCLAAAAGGVPTGVLSAERLLPAMQRALGDVPAEIEILEMSRFPVPEGEVEFSLKDLTPPASANAPTRWRGYVNEDGDHTFSIWAVVRVTARCTRVVATETLTVGRPIQATQVREETYLGSPFRKNASVTLANVIGQAPRRTLRSGTAVLLESVTEPLVVSSGEDIVAEFRSGRLRVTAPVVALGSGRLGEAIAVRNPSSKKIFSAKVSGAGHVIVEELP